MSASAPPPQNPGYPPEQQSYPDPAPYPTQQDEYPQEVAPEQAYPNEKAPYPGDPAYPKQEQQPPYAPQQQQAPYAAYEQQQHAPYDPQQQQAPYDPQQQQPYPAQQPQSQGPPPAYYTPQAAYPTQQGYTAQQTSNVVVVQQQPTTVAYSGQRYSDAGNGALIFSIVVTFIAVFGGCWGALLCSIPAILLANSATTAASRGDQDRAKSNEKMSIGCSVGGLVCGILSIVILVGGLAAYYAVFFNSFLVG